MAGECENSLSIGFRFLPNDDELLGEHLKKKVSGEPLPSNAVIECDIYGNEPPWEMWKRSKDKDFYCFSKLKKKDEKGMRIERTVAGGTWKAQTRAQSVIDAFGNHIGNKQAYMFTGKEREREKWIMHEYQLPQPNNISGQFKDYVLCKIRNLKSSQKPKDKILEQDLDDYASLYSTTDGAHTVHKSLDEGQFMSSFTSAFLDAPKGGHKLLYWSKTTDQFKVAELIAMMARERENSLPVGFQFLPNDKELLEEYLKKKVSGEPLASNAVIERDIYGNEPPWEMWRGSKDKDFYCFSQLKKKGEKGMRIGRTVAGGTWKAQARAKLVVDAFGNHIGHKRAYTFTGKEAERERWIMHEYQLPQSNNSPREVQFKDYVLCKIRNLKRSQKSEDTILVQDVEDSASLYSTTDGAHTVHEILDDAHAVSSDLKNIGYDQVDEGQFMSSFTSSTSVFLDAPKGGHKLLDWSKIKDLLEVAELKDDIFNVEDQLSQAKMNELVAHVKRLPKGMCERCIRQNEEKYK